MQPMTSEQESADAPTVPPSLASALLPVPPSVVVVLAGVADEVVMQAVMVVASATSDKNESAMTDEGRERMVGLSG